MIEKDRDFRHPGGLQEGRLVLVPNLMAKPGCSDAPKKERAFFVAIV
jgi:hypothetical protein